MPFFPLNYFFGGEICYFIHKNIFTYNGVIIIAT